MLQHEDNGEQVALSRVGTNPILTKCRKHIATSCVSSVTPFLYRDEDLVLSFFVAVIPMIYFFIQHKVHRIPGGTLSEITRMVRSNVVHDQLTQSIVFASGS